MRAEHRWMRSFSIVCSLWASVAVVPREANAQSAGVFRTNGDSLLTETQVLRWFNTGAGMPNLRQGNVVTPYIDAADAFSAMYDEMRRANNVQDYVYLANWWVDDRFQLRPGRPSWLNRTLSDLSRVGVEIRAMFWDQLMPITQNNSAAKRIDALFTGAAIIDSRTLYVGSHHQKLLVVGTVDGDERDLVGFCGGIDINPDRIWPRGVSHNKHGSTPGAPFHDVHCSVRGPAAGDLLRIFLQRWADHPQGQSALRGTNTGIPDPVEGAVHWVQVGTTYGNGKRRRGIAFDGLTGTKGYAFAPNGEQDAARMIIAGIVAAERCIYVEDQYFFPTAPTVATGIDVEAAIKVALAKPGFEQLIVLVPHSRLCDVPGGARKRKELIDHLVAAPGGSKVKVYNPRNPGSNHSYVHSKTWVFDDQYAIIGSANTNRRSFTHDSEAVVGFVDQGSDSCARLWAPHEFRVNLWAHHLGTAPDSVLDPIASAALWDTLSTRHVEPYDRTINLGNPLVLQAWDDVIDPDGS